MADESNYRTSCLRLLEAGAEVKAPTAKKLRSPRPQEGGCRTSSTKGASR